MKPKFLDLSVQQNRIKDKIYNSIQRVLDNNNYILGSEVKILEKKLSDFCGSKFAITCGNGTDALFLSLMALNVGKGDVVLCPSFSFSASAEAIPLLGAEPMFVDVDYQNFNIDINSINRCIESAKKQKKKIVGVISVDLFGLPAEYDEIIKIARKEKLWIISDAAQSFGARYKNKCVGNIADITTTSFFPSKPLGCYGDGGAIFTSNESLAEKLYSLRVHGKGKSKYENISIGINSRLDTLQASILIEKLKIFPNEIKLRQNIAEEYNKKLKELFYVPNIENHKSSVWAQYTLKIFEKQNRDEIIFKLNEKNVPTMIYYPIPIHCQDAYKNFPIDPKGLIVSEKLSKSVFSLPLYPYLSNNEQNFIIQTIKDLFI